MNSNADNLTVPQFGPPMRPAPTQDTVDLRRLLIALWRRKWLIVGATVIGMLIAYAIVSRLTPQYTARASVMLDPRTVQVVTSDEIISDLTLNNSVVDTELAVLRSNLLLEQVIASFGPGELDPIDPANDPPGLLSRLRGAIGLGGSGGGAEGASAPITQEERRMRRLLVSMRRKVTVWREGQSYLLSIGVTTTDAVLSKEIANRIAETYISSQIEQRSATIRSASSFLTERVEEIRASVEAAEAAVEEFRRSQLETAGVSAETLEQQLLELSSQVSVAKADLASVKSRFDRIQTLIDAEGIEAASELLSSPLVVALREQLLALRREDADLATRLGPEHPQRQRLQAQIDAIVEDLAAEVRKIVAGLRNDAEVAQIRSESLESSLSEIEERAGAMSRSSLELRQLEREAEAIRSIYQMMLERLNETRSVEQLQRADARMVNTAQVPGAPSAPRTTLFSVLGGTVGFMIGVIAALAGAISTRGFNRASEIERSFGITVLTSLPLGAWRSLRGMQKSIQKLPYQPFADRLRILRENIRPRHISGTQRTVLITSSVPGEGKTTTAVGLATVEGLAHRRCVLLDFDLRRSNLGRELEYDPQGGGDLTALLRGECNVEAAVHRVDPFGFDLITTRGRNPQLIDDTSVERLREVIKDLESRYEMVIVDTPPVLLVADTLTLVGLIDTVLMVVKQTTTRRNAVQDTLRTVEDAGARSIGLVMSMVDSRDEQETYGTSGDYSYANR
ncbi:GumC family protein [Jannaschia aquimarina]|uniref:GumC family protein n=1 Tax=Jannaschia aquimarina TaxID=935700 RepID=UPI0005C6075B|nr:polysaccharide biosynthesis tyrosine autokinase [Jannaschia aquimarina]